MYLKNLINDLHDVYDIIARDYYSDYDEKIQDLEDEGLHDLIHICKKIIDTSEN